MWGLGSCRWWPFVGLFFFLFALAGLVGHWGFGCHKTDPGVTTDPGTMETPTDYNALSTPEPSTPTIPPAVFFLLPMGAGIAASVLSRRRRDS